MGFLSELWLPILVSAVFVFIASSVIHMALPIHKGDYGKLPGEDRILAAMRAEKVAPGQYMFPCAGSMKEMSSPEHVEKCKQGPVGFMSVMPSGAPGMGKNLVQWFVFSIVISIFAAYVGLAALGPTAEYLAVFRFTGTVAFVGYGATHVTNAIWKGESWVVTFKFLFDGLVYGLVTAGTFGWLWPGA